MTRTETLRPGKGWKQLKGPVWEHDSGVRIHVSGRLVRLNGCKVSGPVDESEYSLLRKLTLVNGGNKKRGLMAFALNVKGIAEVLP